jgi:ABC-type Zn uptake system ZnuABC Zn-binding protein ZnuA
MLILAILVLAALASPGCDARPAASANAEREKVRVVTTVYALADIVRQVGGDRVNVEWWVESGQSLADLVETPDRLNQFRNADLVVTRGAPDPWTLAGVGNEYQDRRIIRTDAFPSTRDGDPTQYQWLDPQLALELADEVAARLGVLDPRHDQQFKDNASRFRLEVMTLADQARPALDASNGKFLTLDRGFLPLARRFHMEPVALPSIKLRDPTPYGVKMLKQAATGADARAIFVNADTPAVLLRDWDNRLEGLKVRPLDAFGSSAPSGRSTYAAILRYNLEQIVAGVQGTHPAPPATFVTPPPDDLYGPGTPSSSPSPASTP